MEAEFICSFPSVTLVDVLVEYHLLMVERHTSGLL